MAVMTRVRFYNNGKLNRKFCRVNRAAFEKDWNDSETPELLGAFGVIHANNAVWTHSTPNSFTVVNDFGDVLYARYLEEF
jgi:hypothetical protein